MDQQTILGKNGSVTSCLKLEMNVGTTEMNCLKTGRFLIDPLLEITK